MTKKTLLVFNSGSGSGFQELVENSRTGILDVNIALVSNNENFACVERAKKLRIPYTIMQRFEAEDYRDILDCFKPDFVALSGWLKRTKGLDPKTTFNIHPGPLPAFGGKGMYGHHVHEAVIKAYQEGRIQYSAVTMHFVTEEYDQGPIFFQYPVFIRPDDTPDTLAARVNKIEHSWQSYLTSLVIQGLIYWDGKHHSSLIMPEFM